MLANTVETLAYWFIAGIVLAPMLVLSIVLCTGRGASLLAGYNTMKPEEQRTWDAPAMCRAVGRVMLPCTLLLAGALLAAGYGLFWLTGALSCAYALAIGGIVWYINKSPKFRKK